MSLFSWLNPGRKHRPEPHPSVLPDSALSRIDSTKPVHAAHHHGRAEAANRKHERMARREQLYAVVREAMVRASVLSSSYKFKVLSLDAHGRQFLVMIDLAQGAGSDTSRLAEIEALIAQSAKARHDIMVSAVYWRANEYVAVGDPLQASSNRMPLVSQPAPLHPEPAASARAAQRAVSSRPAPLTEQAAPQAPRTAERRASPVEPLQADEVAAFKKALDAGLRGEQALATANVGKTAPQNYTLLTGFEDTEMANEGEGPGEHLSATQYGGLR